MTMIELPDTAVRPSATAAPSLTSPKRRSLPIWQWALALVAILACAAGGTWWYLNARANWGVVVPGKIYRSAELSRFLVRQKLEKYHVGVIVFLSRDPGNDPDLKVERTTAAELGVSFLNFPMNGDGVAKPEQYTAALTAIADAQRQGKPVLIHCHAGAQRTGGVVAMYRLLVEGKSTADVMAEMRRYGFDPQKNDKLLPFLNENIGRWADELLRANVIARVPDPLPKLAP